jgi:hypothetical protein
MLKWVETFFHVTRAADSAFPWQLGEDPATTAKYNKQKSCSPTIQQLFQLLFQHFPTSNSLVLLF